MIPATTSVPFSVVVGTIQGWPDITPALRSLELAAERVGGEVIVVDGSGKVSPRPDVLAAVTRWVSAPGASVFQCRYQGYRLARGDVVAITEDHCLARADWADRMIASHREHPGAAAIGGRVGNAAHRRIREWAR